MKKKQFLSMLLAMVLLLLAFPVTALANSAEPPGIIIITTNAPEDLTISLEIPLSDSILEQRITKTTKIWEDHYRLYYHINDNYIKDAVLRVESSEKSFTCPLPEDFAVRYNTLMTLDFEAETITMGQPSWRQPVLTAIRIALTLLLEGLLFLIFGYRKLRSWIAFLLINLLTQGALNVMVNGYAFSGGYWIFLFLLMEFGIFIGECIAIPAAITEKKRGISFLFALLANILSLVLGVLLIGRLPL